MRVTLQLVMCNDQGDEESNALHVMLFRTNSIRILFTFNGLRNRYWVVSL